MKILTYMLSNKIALVNQPLFGKNEVKNNFPIFLLFSCSINIILLSVCVSMQCVFHLPTIDKIVLRPGTVITEYTSILLLPIAQLEMGLETEFYLSCGPG